MTAVDPATRDAIAEVLALAQWNGNGKLAEADKDAWLPFADALAPLIARLCAEAWDAGWDDCRGWINDPYEQPPVKYRDESNPYRRTP